MLEERKICPKCGGCCQPDGDEKDKPSEDKEKSQRINSRDEFHFAILLALVPAMTVSLFNLMGLI